MKQDVSMNTLTEAFLNRTVKVCYRSVLNAMSNIIFPPRCAACGSAVWHEGEWCSDCFTAEYKLRIIPGNERDPLERVYVLSEYDKGVKNLIRHIKFNQKKEHSRGLAPFLISFIHSLTKEEWNSIDYIIPIPVSPEKRKSRGYNQVDIIFKDWADAHGNWLDCLAKSNSTKKMYALGRTERKENIAKAFSVKEEIRLSQILKGKKVLIVDDIHTTGATVASAANVLKQEGVSTVWALTIAGAVGNV
ncbi:MAG: ComF family protein [Veillonella sp.]|uniref:ComF family protein n=1 Tax=Veillonella sp. TaxID=1926307 RepID=UPI0025CCD462|nr:ComF family protein [Veillonella sp.]MBS4912651.1 ComF family protein [Veillonella sp.]